MPIFGRECYRMLHPTVWNHGEVNPLRSSSTLFPISDNIYLIFYIAIVIISHPTTLGSCCQK